MVRELVQMNNSACGQLREWVTRSSAAWGNSNDLREWLS
jgi:hypothetical protein